MHKSNVNQIETIFKKYSDIQDMVAMTQKPADTIIKKESLTQYTSPNKKFTSFVVGETSLLIRCVEHLLQQGHIVHGTLV